MSVVVTGGCGFIGSKLIETLEARGETAASVDLVRIPELKHCFQVDIRDQVALEEVMDAMAPVSAVYHFAGPVVELVRKQPRKSVDAQLAGTLAVLDAARKFKVKKIVLASTFYVYSGIGPEHVVNEATPLDVFRMETFGAAKLMCERLVRQYAESYGLDYTVLRFGSAYGHNRLAAGSNAIRTFIELGISGEPIHVWGKGERLNQYTFVDDIVAGCIKALESRNDVFNLVSPQVVTTGELAVMIGELCGFEFIFDSDKPEGASMPFMSSAKAIRMLRWEPRELQAGLRLTVEQFMSRRTNSVAAADGEAHAAHQ
jgi:UDP-glucose 4-epimerase